jgi:hypothetical protein
MVLIALMILIKRYLKVVYNQLIINKTIFNNNKVIFNNNNNKVIINNNNKVII